MIRTTLTGCLLGALVLSGSGCMTCCPPAQGPWDNPFYGCVESGPLGGARPSHAERREMRRALRNSFGGQQCPHCQGGYDMGYDGGYEMGMMPQMSGGGSCPTCQQNMPMNSYPMMESSPGMPGMEVQPHEMMVPNPTLTPMSPTPVNPGATPNPMATPNSTSQFYPTGVSPIFSGSPGGMPMQGPTYGTSYGPVTQRPPQILPFNAASRGQPASYTAAPPTTQMVMQTGAPVQQYSAPQQYSSPQPGTVTSAEMVYIPSQQPHYAPSRARTGSPIQQVLYTP